MVTLVSLNFRTSPFVASPKSLVVPRPKTNPISHVKYPKHLKMRCSRNISSYVRAQNSDVVMSQNTVDSLKDEEKYAKVGLQQGESMIPKHIAISLDGNRRWQKHHGLDLDYRPLFEANMRFVKYCLEWKVTTGTSYIYGLGNFYHRTKEATNLMEEQLERFLEERLEKFVRDGVKVSMVGEKSLISESCQATINKVEEVTKSNINFDLKLAICYTSQRDIVEATRKICKNVQEGIMKLEDVNEEMFEQQLSTCGSRPPLDLFIRTGGQKRIGMLLGWQVPHVELYFTDTYAPDFGEDLFLDALRSFQQRDRWFGK